MKQFSIYIYTLLSLATFSACDEDFTDWAEAQSNPQEEQIAAISSGLVKVEDNEALLRETLESKRVRARYGLANPLPTHNDPSSDNLY